MTDRLINAFRLHGILSCERKAQRLAGRRPEHSANIGCHDNARWSGLVGCDNKLDRSFDFNTARLPYADGWAELVVCEQVIEHLHNTTWFLSELRRITKTGGRLILSTENLCSWPNKLAIALGKAPFSVQPLCGYYIGGWKRGPVDLGDCLPQNHPAFSGVRGHVRVMTVGQIKELLSMSGFRVAGKYGFAFNHYVLFDCVASQKTP